MTVELTVFWMPTRYISSDSTGAIRTLTGADQKYFYVSRRVIQSDLCRPEAQMMEDFSLQRLACYFSSSNHIPSIKKKWTQVGIMLIQSIANNWAELLQEASMEGFSSNKGMIVRTTEIVPPYYCLLTRQMFHHCKASVSKEHTVC